MDHIACRANGGTRKWLLALLLNVSKRIRSECAPGIVSKNICMYNCIYVIWKILESVLV
jgi:hypothetical protein